MNKTQTRETTKRTISIEIERKNGNTFFSFSVPKYVESMYIASPDVEVRESTNWEGLKFYYIPSIVSADSYKTALRNYNLFDDYGQPIFVDDKMNIAWLRTVGGEGKIIVRDHISQALLNERVKSIVAFLKEYFEDYYKECIIKGSLTIEI